MSFLCTDTKGDLFRNYAGIAEKYYGYKISILDLRNPTRSDGDNILGMVNKYMDLWLEDPENIANPKCSCLCSTTPPSKIVLTKMKKWNEHIFQFKHE